MVIVVPSFYRDEKICPVVCGKKCLLSLFSPGVTPAIVDEEFAKVPDGFYWIIDLADHLEMF
jgi:hypothetical protein